MADEDIILTPVFNDWESLLLLIPQIDRSLGKAGRSAGLLVVNDSSDQPVPVRWESEPLQAIHYIDVLTLARNLGHQRAIAIGLSFIAMERPCRAVVVMDADGEDRPDDIPRLMQEFENSGRSRVVFARRTRRSEGFVFTLFYKLYRALHWILTGISVEVGNFSIIPYASVRKLRVVSEMWNHYAAAVVHARLPSTQIPTVRGTRLAGRPTMNFVSLVAHGLSAMSVFADKIGTRLLVVTGFLVTLLLLALGTVVSIRLFTDMAIPGWATVSFGFVTVLLVQAVLLSVVFMFMVQMGRAQSKFIPGEEYKPFVESITRVWEKSE